MRQNANTRAALLVLGGTLLLTGCGLRGDLQRAPPLLGPERQRYEAEQERLAAEAAAKEAAGAAASAQQQQAEPPR